MATFEVSCDMTFASQSDRDAVYAYLLNKYDIGSRSRGDSLATENAADGAYRVACTMRLATEADRDDIYAYLNGNKELSQFGRIEKHLCRHDEDLPCEGIVVDSWR